MISIIICSIDATKFGTVSRMYTELLAAEPHEIIRIANAASLAEGYNRGLAQSKGEIVIFSHDDIHILTHDFAPRLKRHMETYDCVGVAGTTKMVGPVWAGAGPPYIFGQVAIPVATGFQVYLYGAPTRVIPNIQGIDGLFLAFRRDVISTLKWDDQTFDGFHGYDADCTFRAHLAGYRLAVVNDLPMIHFSPGDFGEKFRHYAQLFINKHIRHLEKISPRTYTYATVTVPSKSVAIEVMSPSYWTD